MRIRFCLSLSLVEKAQARREEGDHRCGPVDILCGPKSPPRLIVVLQEAGQTILEVKTCQQVIADARLAVLETVVQPLVVCVIKPLLLERPSSNPQRPRPERGSQDSSTARIVIRVGAGQK